MYLKFLAKSKRERDSNLAVGMCPTELWHKKDRLSLKFIHQVQDCLTGTDSLPTQSKTRFWSKGQFLSLFFFFLKDLFGFIRINKVT